eukprot:COSAG02_NODE_9390_length_2233_cov_1.690722_1_plen_316_part_00
MVEAALTYNQDLSAETDSFEQVGGADRACRSRPKREIDTDYYDRWFTDFVREAAMYQNRERCEFLCATDDACVAYEFQPLDQRHLDNHGIMRGVCEKWRQGPVFESTTDGPSSIGSDEPNATGFSCWTRVAGGKVKATSISGCPMSIASLGLYSLAICSAILVVVCCVCQTQKKRVGNVTIDQSGFVPQADVDLSIPAAQMTPDQISALQTERAALEAALGVSPRSGNGEQAPGANADLQSRLDAAADVQRGDGSTDEARPTAGVAGADEVRPSAPPAADVAFTAAPPAGPLPPRSARPPASPRPTRSHERTDDS